MSILFVTKQKQGDGLKQNSGLMVSAQVLTDYLNSIGYKANYISIPDADFLDPVIKQYNPKIVILEALWIKTEKLSQLCKSNPQLKAIVFRVHSDIPYFAIEPYGFETCFNIQNIQTSGTPKLYVAANCENFHKTINSIANIEYLYLPNIHDSIFKHNPKQLTDEIHVGLYGSIRLLKNHLFQAMAACHAAKRLNKRAVIHINNNVNDAGSAVLQNLRNVFNSNGYHKLIDDGWMDRDTFKSVIRGLDIGMQLSFTESFNIVAADFVSNGVPILGSDTIYWMPDYYKTSTTQIKQVSDKFIELYHKRNDKMMLGDAFEYLVKYNNSAKAVWDSWLRSGLF